MWSSQLRIAECGFRHIIRIPSPKLHSQLAFNTVDAEPQIRNLVILSGPSGVGKSTVLRRLLARYPEHLRLSVSATTRPPRPGETDGVDYYFLSPDEFARRRDAGDFLECCEV